RYRQPVVSRRYRDPRRTDCRDRFGRSRRRSAGHRCGRQGGVARLHRPSHAFRHPPAGRRDGTKRRAARRDARRPGRERLDRAAGLSTAYEGGGYDNPEEIFAMAKVAAQYGGYYGSHVGSEGYQLVEEVKKAIAVAEVAGLAVHIYHLKIRGTKLWGQAGPA